MRPRKPVAKPLVAFRVYPENRFLYAVVNIWPTKKAMYQHKPLGRNHEASCSGITRIVVAPRGSKTRQRKRGEFAEINFYRGALGVGVVSHEFTHATFCWAERRKLKRIAEEEERGMAVKGGEALLPLDGVEERFCYALGEMCRQFTLKCYELDLYKGFAVVAK